MLLIFMLNNFFQIEAIQELKDLKEQGTPTILAGDGKYDLPGVTHWHYTSLIH